MENGGKKDGENTDLTLHVTSVLLLDSHVCAQHIFLIFIVGFFSVILNLSFLSKHLVTAVQLFASSFLFFFLIIFPHTTLGKKKKSFSLVSVCF